MMTDFEPRPDECLLHVIRHGATPHNMLSPPRMQGRSIDQSLADVGRRQAERIAAALQTCRLVAVVASPLRRAMETAETIAACHSIGPVPDERLVEANVGRWEDRSWPEIKATDDDAYQRFRADPVEHGYPDGESLGSVLERGMTAMREIASMHPGQHVAVVAHSVVNRVLLGELLGVPISARHSVPQSNCGWSIVRWRRDSQKVLCLNGVQHLGD